MHHPSPRDMHCSSKLTRPRVEAAAKLAWKYCGLTVGGWCILLLKSWKTSKEDNQVHWTWKIIVLSSPKLVWRCIFCSSPCMFPMPPSPLRHSCRWVLLHLFSHLNFDLKHIFGLVVCVWREQRSPRCLYRTLTNPFEVFFSCSQTPKASSAGWSASWIIYTKQLETLNLVWMAFIESVTSPFAKG